VKRLITILIVIISSSACLAALNKASLPDLSKKNFIGKDLKLLSVLTTTEAYTSYNISYLSGKWKISGKLSVPKGAGPFPVIITAQGFIDPRFNTGGKGFQVKLDSHGFEDPFELAFKQGLKKEQDYFASHGYVVLQSDYRNNGDSDMTPGNDMRLNLGFTEDLINAVYAIKASGFKFIDKNNIGVLGHSLGGGLALNMMVVRPGLVKAYVLFAPISSDYRDYFNKWTVKEKPAVAKKIIDTYGSIKSNKTFWDNMSPKTFIKKATEPVMIHHGTADAEVPVEWSDNLETLLRTGSKEVTLYKYENERHTFSDAWPQVMERSLQFFDKYLKNNAK
jgi:uncharacterized protein